MLSSPRSNFGIRSRLNLMRGCSGRRWANHNDRTDGIGGRRLAHRPLQIYEVTMFTDGQPSFAFLGWSRGVPQTCAGDLKMVAEWSRLGFAIRNRSEEHTSELQS